MKRKTTVAQSAILGVALALTFGGPASSAAASRRDGPVIDVKAANEVLLQEAAWNDALISRDRNALGSILADEFTFKDVAGKTYTQAQYIDTALRTARPMYYSMTEVRPTPAGDKATATGRLTVARTNASGDFRFSDTLVKRAGRWQIVTSQETRVAPGQ